MLHVLLDAVFPPRETELLVRGLTPDSLADLMQPKIVHENGALTSEIIGLFPYAHPAVRACILEAKFHGNKYAAQLLGAALSDFLYEFLSESAPLIYKEPIYIPLPLSTERLRERGYNQAERIASAATSLLLKAACTTHLLRRTRNAAPQTSLGARERRTNLCGAFEVNEPCDPCRTYIMVDDVTTTGSTMEAASAAMVEGGAKRLLLIALAY